MNTKIPNWKLSSKLALLKGRGRYVLLCDPVMICIIKENIFIFEGVFFILFVFVLPLQIGENCIFYLFFLL